MARVDIVVGLITEDNDFQRRQAEDARKTAEREKLSIEVLFAGNNAIEQIQQMYRFVHAAEDQRPAAILVESVGGDGLERIARKAVQQGIGWVLINRKAPYIAALQQEHPERLILSLGTDQLAIGRLQGQQYRALLPNGGRVLYVQGPAETSAAIDRRAGMEQILSGSGIEVSVIEAQWTAESAERAVKSWWRLATARSLRIDLVGAQNDAMAVGVTQAVRAHPDEALRAAWMALPYAGVDGLPEGGKRLVDTGVLAATIIAPSNTGPAIELVAKVLRKREMPPPIVLLAPVAYPLPEKLALRRPAPTAR
jgi:ABC-type sugar transport system substrate-binding protein